MMKILFFETRSRFFSSYLVVRDEIDIFKISSRGGARKNGPDDGLGKSPGQ